MRKTIKKAVCALAAVASIMSMAILPVSASTSDSIWTVNSSSVYTKYRQKDTTTSVYFKNNSTTTSVRIYVKGAYAENGPTYDVSSNSSHPNVYNTDNLLVPPNRTYEVYQYIKENGYSYAWMYVKGSSYAAGRWSPDTSGHFPVLNPA